MVRKVGAILIGILVIFWMVFPLWLDMNYAQTKSQEFIKDAKENNVEVKIVSAIHYPENFFTWLTPMPRFTVARKLVGSSYLMAYQKITDDGVVSGKALISAVCAAKTYRLVDKHTYGKLLKEQSYDIFGRKLPAWEDADVESMQSAMLSIKPSQERNNLLYHAACEWDKINI